MTIHSFMPVSLACRPWHRRVLVLALTTIAPLASLQACATTQTVGEQTDDNVVSTRVSNRLAADTDVRRFKIDVDTLNGAVTLRGEVPSELMSQKAEQIARETKGVASVNNKLLVDAETSSKPDGDGLITARVKSRLMADPEVQAADIDVDTQDGVVTLSGIVQNDTVRDEAVRLARNTEGVADVVSELNVDNQTR